MIQADTRTYKNGDGFHRHGDAWEPPSKTHLNGLAQSGPRAIVRCVADVQDQETDWLWRGYIPRGMVSLLDGDPGLGKSFITLELAARLTRGMAMPGEKPRASKPAGVILLNAEDDAGRTIRPRLHSLGADVCRVHLFEHVIEGQRQRPPMMPDDCDLLGNLIQDHDAGLLIIDPFMAFLSGDVDSHKDSDVRRVMYALRLLAEKTGAAVLIVRHLNKLAGGGDPLYRGGGSIGIIGAARSALLVAKHPDDDSLRVLARTKGNLCAEPPALSYRIVPQGSGATVEWQGAVQLGAGDLLSRRTQDRQQRSERMRDATARLLCALDRLDPQRRGVSRRQVRGRAGLSGALMIRAAQELIDGGTLREIEVEIWTGRNRKVRQTAEGLVRSTSGGTGEASEGLSD